MFDTLSTANLLKAAWTTLLGWSAAVFLYFEPVQNFWIAVTILWVFNLILGYTSGYILTREKLDTKKFLLAAGELVLYLVTTALFLAIGKLMNNLPNVLTGLNIATWAFIAYFTTGILKNWSRLQPNNWVVKYLYYILSLEILNKLPHFKEFKNQQENGKDSN